MRIIVLGSALAVGLVLGCGSEASETSARADSALDASVNSQDETRTGSDDGDEPAGSGAALASDDALTDEAESGSDGAGTPGSTSGVVGSSPTGDNTFDSFECLRGDTACTNCEDDDGDGLIDAFDPECTGPLDNDEGSFATGIPGDNIDFCQDCFFDGNSGHGDDGCQYHTECLYGNASAARGNSGCFSCDVSNECRNNCLPYTPNGCDCFGCCEVYDDGEPLYVLLESSCSLDTLEGCTACQPSTDCVNECDPCEICIGKTELDPSCGNSDNPPPGDDGPDDPDAGTPGGDDPDSGASEPPLPQCAEGQQACTAAMPCAAGHFCLTGCCVANAPRVR